MPLIKSGSKQAISTNIREMMHAGHPQKQAIAAAYATARKYARRYGGRAYANGGGDDELPEGTVPKQGQEIAPPSTEPLGQQFGRAMADYARGAYRNVSDYLTKESPPTTAQTAAPGKIPSENPYTAGALSTGTDILTSLINPEMGAGAAAFKAGMLIPPGKKAASEMAGQFFLKGPRVLAETPQNTLTGAQWAKRFEGNVKKEETAWTVGPYLERHANDPITKDQLRQVMDENGRYLDFSVQDYHERSSGWRGGPPQKDYNRFGPGGSFTGSATEQSDKYHFEGGLPGTYKELPFTLPSRDRPNVQPSQEVMDKYTPQLTELQDRKDQLKPAITVLQDRLRQLEYATDPVSQSIRYQTLNELSELQRQLPVAELAQLKQQMIDETIQNSGRPMNYSGATGKPDDYREGNALLGQRDYGTLWSDHPVHWGSSKNVFAAPRIDARDLGDGKKTLFIHEMQSDIHQDAVKYKGYADVLNPEAQEAAFQKARQGFKDARQQKEMEFGDALDAKNAEQPIPGYYSAAPELVKVAHAAERSFNHPITAGTAYKDAVDSIRSRYGDDIAKLAQDYGKARLQEYKYDAAHNAGETGHVKPNMPWKRSAQSGWDNLAFKYLLQYAVDNGFDQIALPEASQYARLPYGRPEADERALNGIQEYYGDVFPKKMNKEVLAKAGIKDARWDLDPSKMVSQKIKELPDFAKEKEEFLTNEMKFADQHYPDQSTLPEAERNEYTQRTRDNYLQGMYADAEQKFGPEAQAKAVADSKLNLHILPITDSIKAAIRDPKNPIHQAFKRGGGVMPGYAGGGFAGSTPWYVRQEARGMVHGGMLGGGGMGRDDNLPISVPSGAYVVPADIVSGIGQGNSHAGGSILAKAFGTGPLGMPAMHTHGGFGGPKNVRMGMMKMPRGSSSGSTFTQTKTSGFEYGGAAPPLLRIKPPGMDDEQWRLHPDNPVIANYQSPGKRPWNQIGPGGATGPYGIGSRASGGETHTPIVAASGEFVIHPDRVRQIGKGDLKRGHDVLDKLMLDLRKKHVKQLQKLPGPVKRARGGRVPSPLPDTRAYLDVVTQTLRELQDSVLFSYNGTFK